MWSSIKRNRWAITYATLVVLLSVRAVDSYGLAPWTAVVALIVLGLVTGFVRDKFLSERDANRASTEGGAK